MKIKVTDTNFPAIHNLIFDAVISPSGLNAAFFTHDNLQWSLCEGQFYMVDEEPIVHNMLAPEVPKFEGLKMIFGQEVSEMTVTFK